MSDANGAEGYDLNRYLAIFAPVAAVGGFIADVVQPLAPLSTYIFWASLIATVVLLIGVFVVRSARPRLLPLLVLTGSFLAFSGIFLMFMSKDSEDTGVLASKFPFVAELQKTLGLIHKDMAEIKEATRKTSEGVVRVEKNTQSIAESSERMALSLEAIRQGFAGLDKAGGIIRDAQKPEEHYHNARLYEQGGDYGNARRSYNAFFAFKLDVIDPHIRYQTFLKIQEGRAGARELYSAIYQQDKRPLIDFARILLFDAPQRLDLLKEFLAANQEFAPGYYELSREYSAARKGTQSLGDKQAELAALERFKALHAEGKLVKYFLDQSAAAEWLDDADRRLKSLAALKQSSSQMPVALSAMRSNADWTIVVQLREVPREIFYRLEGEGAFRSTGVTDVVDSATGLKVPNSSFSLKPGTRRTRIEIKYVDVGNEMRGPFVLEFDPSAELVAGQKKMLGMTKNGWLSFRDHNGRLLLYFTHLISNRCAIDKIAYGIDSDSTPSEFALEPCNPAEPYSVGNGLIYVEVPANSRYASVRLTFKDGSTSEIVRIDR
jgi:hypothetical protein